jgi:hypothetical protein
VAPGPTAPKREGKTRLARFILSLLALLFASGPALPNDTVEHAVKAAYLYKLPPFVDWPEGSFSHPDSAFVLCIVGDDAFGGLAQRAIADQGAGQRRIELRVLRVVDDGSGCHIAFLAGTSSQSVAEALEVLKDSPVLTVTDSARSSAKGIIHFVLNDNRVRFEIDDVAAARKGLAISSKLLSLAVLVRRR